MAIPEQAALACAVRDQLPAEVRRDVARRAAQAFGCGRRQITDEAVTISIRIQPVHALTPEQLAALRSFWGAVLAAEPALPAREEVGSDA